MSEKLVLEGLTVAPSVIETIVKLATEKVDGVAVVGAPTMRRATVGKAVDISTDDQGGLVLDIHIQAMYGSKLHEVGTAIQNAVADALTVQVGAKAAAINIYIDALVFAE